MNCPLNPKIGLLNPELFIPDKITPANQSEAVLSYVTYVRVAIQLAFFFLKNKWGGAVRLSPLSLLSFPTINDIDDGAVVATPSSFLPRSRPW